VVPDQLEGLPVAGEHVVLLLHRADEVGLKKVEMEKFEKFENALRHIAMHLQRTSSSFHNKYVGLTN
jgi:hypothetical protein